MAKQQAAEQEATRLQQQLSAVRRAAEAELAQLHKAVAAEQAGRVQQEAALWQEIRHLRSEVASAHAALKAAGIPAQKVGRRLVPGVEWGRDPISMQL